MTARILLVDAEPAARSTMVATLEEQGHLYAECDGGAQAYVRLRRESFDLVVSDVRVPEIDGLDLLDMVSSMRTRPQVILTSKHASPECVRRAFRSGAFDILPKPLDPDELRRAIEDALLQPNDTAVTPNPTNRARSTSARSPRATTGLLTRRAFADSLTQMRSKCRHLNQCTSLVVIVLDGSPREPSGLTGDVLRAMELALAETVRSAGQAVRYDADRFIFILENTHEAGAEHYCDRLRDCFSRFCDESPSATGRVRMSFGIAVSQPGFVESEEDLVDRGLLAAAEASHRGTGRTVCWSDLQAATPSQRQLDRASVDDIAVWITKARQQLKRSGVESALALVAAVEAKEPLARGHARTVSHYCEMIARRMDLSPSQIESIKVAALLHDIGKIGVPDRILQKPGPLTGGEYALIKKHPETALQILENSTSLQDELPYILHHHERFDGAGYPHGIAGTDIPLAARILCVGDSIAAMMSARSYKSEYSLERTRSELARCSGTQFDPVAVRAAIEWIENDPDALQIDPAIPLV